MVLITFTFTPIMSPIGLHRSLEKRVRNLVEEKQNIYVRYFIYEDFKKVPRIAGQLCELDFVVALMIEKYELGLRLSTD